MLHLPHKFWHIDLSDVSCKVTFAESATKVIVGKHTESQQKELQMIRPKLALTYSAVLCKRQSFYSRYHHECLYFTGWRTSAEEITFTLAVMWHHETKSLRFPETSIFQTTGTLNTRVNASRQEFTSFPCHHSESRTHNRRWNLQGRNLLNARGRRGGIGA